MPDIMSIDLILSEKGFFEWEQAQEAPHGFANPDRPARSPRPNLRRDQVDDRNAQRLQFLRHAKVKIRAVGQERKIGALRLRRGNQFSKLAVNPGEMGNHLKKSHYG